MNAACSAVGGGPASHGSAVLTCDSIRRIRSRMRSGSTIFRNRYETDGYV